MKSLRLLCAALALALAATQPCWAQTALAASDDDTTAAVSAAQEDPADLWDRIRAGFRMPDLATVSVERQTQFYTRNSNFIGRVSERAVPYLYQIVEEIENRGMPTELALLPFVESAFQPEAKSPAKAVGLWQFIPSTGRNFALDQNLWHDQRRDVLESTRAALDYFEKLYDQFHDWHLCLAAYNWGEGAVARAIARNQAKGLPTEYQYLSMPRETAGYVPRLQAIKNIISNPEHYGVQLPEIPNEPYFVRISIDGDLDRSVIARLAEMAPAEFRRLNPSLNRPIIPGSLEIPILLPAHRAEIFIENLASWRATGRPLSTWKTFRVPSTMTVSEIADKFGMSPDEVRETNQIPLGCRVEPGSTLVVRGASENASLSADEVGDARLRTSTEPRRIVYRVRRSDTLRSIAIRYLTTPEKIREDNGLESGRLHAGQRLVLVVPPRIRTASATPATARPVSRRTGASGSRASGRKGASKGAARPASSKGQAAAKAQPAAARTVKAGKGDTLYSISRRSGVSLDQLRKANGIKGSTVRSGQVLRVPGK